MLIEEVGRGERSRLARTHLLSRDESSLGSLRLRKKVLILGEDLGDRDLAESSELVDL